MIKINYNFDDHNKEYKTGVQTWSKYEVSYSKQLNTHFI